MNDNKTSKYVFQFECDQAWESLSETDDEKIRHCPKCNTNVHSVNDAAEFKATAEKGHCLYSIVLRTAGIPCMPPENSSEKLSAAKKWWEFWK